MPRDILTSGHGAGYLAKKSPFRLTHSNGNDIPYVHRGDFEAARALRRQGYKAWPSSEAITLISSLTDTIILRTQLIPSICNSNMQFFRFISAFATIVILAATTKASSILPDPCRSYHTHTQSSQSTYMILFTRTILTDTACAGLNDGDACSWPICPPGSCDVIAEGCTSISLVLPSDNLLKFLV